MGMNITINNLVTQKKRIFRSDGTGLGSYYSARLILVQGTEGVASRPIYATVAGERVNAIYTDTGRRIRGHKMLQAIWDAMNAENGAA